MANPVNELLPPLLLRTIDPVCDAFELALKEGRRPVIEEQLDSVGEVVRPLLLIELIRTEMEWRCRLGAVPTAADYRRRFPACASTVDHWLVEARTAAEAVAACRASETDGPEFPRTSTFVGQAAGLSLPGRPAACPRGWASTNCWTSSEPAASARSTGHVTAVSTSWLPSRCCWPAPTDRRRV